MRVVFMGTPAFAVPTLEALIAHHDVVAVYARPDRGGRSRRAAISPVVERAEAAGLVVERPFTLRDPEAVDRLRTLAPEVIVVAAYGLILPAEVLTIPAHGCVNVHGSLLPRWRGAAPVQRAILEGDGVTGVSIMRMEEGLDTGPWCRQASVDVDDKTVADLTCELAVLGADELVAGLAAIEDGSVRWTEQDDTHATYAHKVSTADVALDPSLTVDQALRRVRASGPSAPCRAQVGGRGITVLSASRGQQGLGSGRALCARGLEIGLADGSIVLERMIPEGRSAMDGGAFVRGAHLDTDCTWGRR